MNQVSERAAAVVTQKLTDKVVSRLTGGDQDRYAEAVAEERQARAEAIARATARTRGNDTTVAADSTTPTAIKEIMDDEDCPVCSSILAAVAEMDEPKRTKGVAEYGEFRSAIEESEDAATAVLEDSEVLVDALNDLPGGEL